MDLQIKQSYSFEVYPAALLGNGFQNVTVMAIMDFESASKEFDAQARHVQVYPSLPAGSTPNNPAEYLFVKLRLANGTTTILGLPWIKQATIAQISSSTITVKIAGASVTDLPLVRAALVQNGFKNIQVSIQT